MTKKIRKDQKKDTGKKLKLNVCIVQQILRGAHETIFSGLKICKMALSNQIEFRHFLVSGR
jgi:hypothetical protein